MSLVVLDTPRHADGITYITFDEVAGGGITYDVYRKSTQITSLSGLTKIATLDQNSGRLLYDDSAITDGQNLTSGLIVVNSGSHLAAGKGFIAITTHSGEDGNWYYCIVNSGDATVTVGTNSFTSPVAEVYKPYPGGVKLGTEIVGSYTVHKYEIWEDIRTWNTTTRGYYGKRVNVAAITGNTSPVPLLISLHGAPQQGYFEPRDGAFSSINYGTVILPIENDFSATTDPYAGTSIPTPSWLGLYNSSTGFWELFGIERLVRYCHIVRDNIIGDSVDFHVNSNRVHPFGGSMGSVSMHLAGHYPTLFASAGVAIGWVDSTSRNFGNESALVLNGGGQTFTQWADMAYQASIVALPPIVHQFSANDHTITPAAYKNAMEKFELYHQAYYAQWMNTDHVQANPTYATMDPESTPGAGYLRYLLNESYPCFGYSSASDSIPSFPSANAGQRNASLDWHSSLHSITNGSAIADNLRTYAISLRSNSNATGVILTIRNQQLFRPVVGSVITYLTDDAQSGSATVNSDGSVTLSSALVYTADTTFRLTITDQGQRVGWLKS